MKVDTVFLGPKSGGNENEKVDWKQREGTHAEGQQAETV